MRIPFPNKVVPHTVALQELRILSRLYPRTMIALEYHNPFELLVATILSAQNTDVRANMVTPALFRRYPTAGRLAQATQDDIEELIKTCGFYHVKARQLIGAAKRLVEDFGGEVPRAREKLETLPGVGRKTASVILSAAFKEPVLVVERHVFRVAHRMGLTTGNTPRKVEDDLIELVPRSKWRNATNWFILHGRRICVAPIPKCGLCPERGLCPTPAIITQLGSESMMRRAGLPTSS